MLLDVFKSDAFGLTSLITAINKVPYVPTKLGKRRLFAESGVSSLTVSIEMQDGVLTLVPTAPRGSRGPAKNLQRRNIRDFRPVHLPQSVALLADEVQGLRAFGSQTEEEVAMSYLMKKAAVARRDLDVTHEWQRVGALKGVVLDADGVTTIYNFATEFGVSPLTNNFALSNAGTKVVQTIVGYKRQIEDKLGGVMVEKWEAMCSPGFIDAMTGNAAVQETYKYQEGKELRADYRGGFWLGDVWWEEYRGSIGGTPFIGTNKAILYPVGVPDMFKTVFAPANYMETVNTEGVPFYMKGDPMRHDIGIDYDLQSNPLHMNTRPDCVMELTAT